MGTAGLTIALAGNPNSGKTTIFNNITGARQHVGNYPGVTVERREGARNFQGQNLVIVDLPGTYSLTAYSLDEIVARNFIVEEKPDIIVNVLDAGNLERNLYLAVQLLELERPVALALNMVDTADKLGFKIDDKKLGQKLGVPIVRTVGNRNEGTDALLAAAVNAASVQQQPIRVDYGDDVEQKIALLTQELETVEDLKYPKRWLAVKLLENDSAVNENVAALQGGTKLLLSAEQARSALKTLCGDDAETVIADRRYRFVGEVFRDAVVKDDGAENFSDKVDKVLTNRVLGLPIFLVLMWLLFNFVFTVGAYPQEWIENGVGLLGKFVGSHMADGDLKSLIVDGIIGGVGGVITFLPNIVLLFLGISILEDSGYMARAAFVMDRVMRFAGLHGKSFIPMLMGFGCAVPAIMGTRTLENPRDRMVTIFVIPLMSCGARLPVYTLLISAFFAPDVAGTVLFSLYVLGIVLAVIVAFIIRGSMLKGDSEPFVMELPPYHMPALRSVLMHMWERAVLYLKKAGTIILAVSIIVWFLTSYPSEVDFTKDYEGLTAAADTAFTETVDQKVFAPLAAELLVAENAEEQSALESLTAEVDDVYAEFEEQTAELKAGSAELAALTTSKDEKLKQLETDNEKLYPLVAAFMDEKDKIKEVSEQIAALDTQFEEESEELEEGSAEFLALETEKDAKLTELEAENQKLFPLAVQYHELQSEHDEQIAQLEQQQASEKIAGSYAGRLGKMIEPVIAPLGFDWKIGIALITGFAAKEVVVSTLGTIYSIGEADETSAALKATLLADPTFSPLVAYALMAFVLIYVPCLTAMAVIKRETNSWKWTGFVVVYTTALAWIVSFIIYHGGQALGF